MYQLSVGATNGLAEKNTKIVHDTEYYILEAQNGETTVDIDGSGLAGKEVTLAELLSDSGYNTVHIGKWHMGDIMESWPNHQGFDFAAFPIHQQGQLTVFNDDAAAAGIAVGIGKNQYDDRFTLDHWFRPDPAHMATVVEGRRGEKVREVHMQAGERWNQKKYNEMNERLQRQALEHLGKLAKQAGRLAGKSEMTITFTGLMINNQIRPIRTGAIQAVADSGQGRNTAGKVVRGAAIGGLADGKSGAKTGAKIGAGAAVLTRGGRINIPANTLLEVPLDEPFTL